MRDQRVEFEAALGCAADWDPMDGRKATRIVVTSIFDDIQRRQDWPTATEWLIDMVIRFRKAVDPVGGIVDWPHRGSRS